MADPVSLRRFGIGVATILLIVSTEPGAAQETRAGVLTCDVSAGLGLIVGSQKELSCAFAPTGSGRREDYGGVITKFGLDLGIIGGGVMVWEVFTRTVAGPGFLAGDYVGVSGEAPGRIDDPNGGWKGRGLYATVSTRTPFHMETGKGTTSKVMHFQMRPDPLAK